MLVLSRKAGEAIVIGDNVIVTVKKIKGNRVSLAVVAPASVVVSRSELRRAETVTTNKPERAKPTE